MVELIANSFEYYLIDFARIQISKDSVIWHEKKELHCSPSRKQYLQSYKLN